MSLKLFAALWLGPPCSGRSSERVEDEPRYLRPCWMDISGSG